MTEYQDFVAFTDERYTECTLEEKLTVYLQHFSAKAVPLLLELIEAKDLWEFEKAAYQGTLQLERRRLKQLERRPHGSTD